MINNKSKADFRIVFMGTPEFAVESLKALIENQFNVVGVVTNADKPAGRGQKIIESAVKQYADSQNIPVLQPEKLKDPQFQKDLKELEADLQVIVAFRMLPESVWNLPPMGSINVHASLLPHYRGAAPINHVIINGETYSGVTTFFLKHEIDTGDILFYEKVPILPEDNAGSLHDKLMTVGANLLIKSIEAIIANNYTEIPQSQLIGENEMIKMAPKIFKEDCRIDWSAEPVNIINLIRGLSPYPASFTELIREGHEPLIMKVFLATFHPKTHHNEIGSIASDMKNFIHVQVNGGYIELLEIQIAGKRRMMVAEFLRGFKDITVYRLK
jgi:methionyl-tRNA formyltransferase